MQSREGGREEGPPSWVLLSRVTHSYLGQGSPEGQHDEPMNQEAWPGPGESLLPQLPP